MSAATEQGRPSEPPNPQSFAQAGDASELSPVSVKRARSRRLYYLERLLRYEYFTIESIQARDPYFYQTEFVDKFSAAQKRASEKRERRTESESRTIVDQLLGGIDRAERGREVARRRAEEEEVEEEEDEESDGSEVEMEEGKRRDAGTDDDREEGQEGDSELAPEDDPIAVREFVMLAEQRWLDGLEPGFDYKAVDTDEANDDLRIVNQDAEDAYFDEESTDEDDREDNGMAEGEYDY